MKAIGYARVSTIAQRDDGNIEIQVDAIKAFATKNNYEIDDALIFRDDGIAGDLENRAGWLNLMTYIRDNKIDALIIFKLDRLARDIVIEETFMREIDRIGIRLISLNDPHLSGTDPAKVLFRQLLGAYAQYEKAMITMRLTAGKMKNAREGGFNGGIVPYGYDNISGDLVIKIVEARIVEIIYRMRARGFSTSRIAKELDKMRIGHSAAQRSQLHVC